MVQNLSDAQLLALAITPHITGTISVVASSYVLQDILKDPKKRKRTYCRLVFGMASIDFITSLMYALCTLPMEPSSLYGTFAFGNQATCTAQAFLIQMEIASPIYHFYLAWYYLLILKYRWPERKFGAYENKLHAFAMFFSLATSIGLLPLNVYGEFFVWCWITNEPGNGWYQWIFFFGPLWFIILVSSVIMAQMCIHVKAEEMVSRKWRNSIVDTRKLGEKKLKKMAARVFWQAVHYELAFYATWTIPTIAQTIQQAAGIPPNFGMQLATAIFTPLAGFFNFTIYIRPRYVKYYEENKKEMWWYILFKAVKTAVPSRKMKMEIVSINLEDLDYNDDDTPLDEPNRGEDDATSSNPSSSVKLQRRESKESDFTSYRDEHNAKKYGYEDPNVAAKYGYEDPDSSDRTSKLNDSQKQNKGDGCMSISEERDFDEPSSTLASSAMMANGDLRTSKLDDDLDDSTISIHNKKSISKSASRPRVPRKHSSVFVLDFEENDMQIVDPGAALEQWYEVDKKIKRMKLPKNKHGKKVYRLVKKINKGVKKRRRSMLQTVRNLMNSSDRAEPSSLDGVGTQSIEGRSSGRP